MPNDHDLRRRSPISSTAMAAAAEDAFKLVIFNIGNADFDLEAWVRDFDLAGDAVE
jgi:hypothetical protein